MKNFADKLRDLAGRLRSADPRLVGTDNDPRRVAIDAILKLAIPRMLHGAIDVKLTALLGDIAKLGRDARSDEIVSYIAAAAAYLNAMCSRRDYGVCHSRSGRVAGAGIAANLAVGLCPRSHSSRLGEFTLFAGQFQRLRPLYAILAFHAGAPHLAAGPLSREHNSRGRLDRLWSRCRLRRGRDNVRHACGLCNLG